jgi:hypothetical protein
MENQSLAKLPELNGIDAAVAAPIIEAFLPHFKEAARKTAAAPDKEKLMMLARELRIFAQSPKSSLRTTAADELMGWAILSLGKLASEIERRAASL